MVTGIWWQSQDGGCQPGSARLARSRQVPANQMTRDGTLLRAVQPLPLLPASLSSCFPAARIAPLSSRPSSSLPPGTENREIGPKPSPRGAYQSEERPSASSLLGESIPGAHRAVINTVGPVAPGAFTPHSPSTHQSLKRGTVGRDIHLCHVLGAGRVMEGWMWVRRSLRWTCG